ncbi:MAG: methionyl-tRNA formyltransferase [Bacteroidetes bacterium 4484_249]|nr:MAG: methionyl-tRNA formyltransferase [Bacteroidetes bacterium 4484_249]
MKIIFMGTPDFAVPGLDILMKHGYNIAGVVTAADKPAGRGRKIKYSPVKKFALENNIPVFQPTNLKENDFVKKLKSLKPDLFIVVAFRMLPKVIWQIPKFGTFNLHASLLPQYRGAAPINWAIINGEKETGVTTFFIDEKIDTGKIIFTEKTEIGEDENAGDLHDRLMEMGAGLILKTVRAIENRDFKLIDQDNLNIQSSNLKPAPKIYKDDCKINWNRNTNDIYNFIRGLSPYPTAFTKLVAPDKTTRIVKIFKAGKIDYKPENFQPENLPGSIYTDGKNYLKVYCNDGLLDIEEIQMEGKRRMKMDEFLRGFSINNEWKMV